MRKILIFLMFAMILFSIASVQAVENFTIQLMPNQNLA